MMIFWFMLAGAQPARCDSNILKEWEMSYSLAPYELAQALDYSKPFKAPDLTKPPLNNKKIAYEILAGFGVGIPAAAATFFGLGYGISGQNPLYLEGEPEAIFFTGVITLFGACCAYVFGSALGVYWVGNSGNETGSLEATLWGSVLGMSFGMCPVGATAGFNLSRKYKTVEGGSLIDINDGRLSPGLPEIYLRQSMSDEKALGRSMDLVKVRF
jgi:hypothetical protein